VGTSRGLGIGAHAIPALTFFVTMAMERLSGHLAAARARQARNATPEAPICSLDLVDEEEVPRVSTIRHDALERLQQRRLVRTQFEACEDEASEESCAAAFGPPSIDLFTSSSSPSSALIPQAPSLKPKSQRPSPRAMIADFKSEEDSRSLRPTRPPPPGSGSVVAAIRKLREEENRRKRCVAEVEARRQLREAACSNDVDEVQSTVPSSPTSSKGEDDSQNKSEDSRTAESVLLRRLQMRHAARFTSPTASTTSEIEVPLSPTSSSKDEDHRQDSEDLSTDAKIEQHERVSETPTTSASIITTAVESDEGNHVPSSAIASPEPVVEMLEQQKEVLNSGCPEDLDQSVFAALQHRRSTRAAARGISDRACSHLLQEDSRQADYEPDFGPSCSSCHVTNISSTSRACGNGHSSPLGISIDRSSQDDGVVIFDDPNLEAVERARNEERRWRLEHQEDDRRERNCWLQSSEDNSSSEESTPNIFAAGRFEWTEGSSDEECLLSPKPPRSQCTSRRPDTRRGARRSRDESEYQRFDEEPCDASDVFALDGVSDVAAARQLYGFDEDDDEEQIFSIFSREQQVAHMEHGGRERELDCQDLESRDLFVIHEGEEEDEDGEDEELLDEELLDEEECGKIYSLRELRFVEDEVKVVNGKLDDDAADVASLAATDCELKSIAGLADDDEEALDGPLADELQGSGEKEPEDENRSTCRIHSVIEGAKRDDIVTREAFQFLGTTNQEVLCTPFVVSPRSQKVGTPPLARVPSPFQEIHLEQDPDDSDDCHNIHIVLKTAATLKIQAAFRRFIVSSKKKEVLRSSSIEKPVRSSSVEAAARRLAAIRSKALKEREAQAATRLQSCWRGFSTRREIRAFKLRTQITEDSRLGNLNFRSHSGRVSPASDAVQIPLLPRAPSCEARSRAPRSARYSREDSKSRSRASGAETATANEVKRKPQDLTPRTRQRPSSTSSTARSSSNSGRRQTVSELLSQMKDTTMPSSSMTPLNALPRLGSGGVRAQKESRTNTNSKARASTEARSLTSPRLSPRRSWG
jgi:hypothetical protein